MIAEILRHVASSRTGARARCFATHASSVTIPAGTAA